ncbi:FecCD family ABC transporter permease [Anaerotignum sp. MB30-C6]|uniref:FecCD family ABC transporter permease n=1 Tax=Anaerotignum sp. MB30-C6 TaxID=3070814 RepID=UPI0027DBE0E1|nr:iron ABC transporter permease [Anaerotignum sp. MB30-C6]WMI80562.1 iron ABC transporter permease [Anaerotignum sp. MB30-C6]
MRFLRNIYQTKSKTFENVILLLSVTFLVLLIIVAILVGAATTATVEIILLVRLPRVLGAICAGAALSACGLILQNLMGNPLAGPNIIGVNSGAAFLTVVAALLFPANPVIQPIFAFMGAFIVILSLYLLSSKSGISKMTIILFGVAMNSLFNALTESVYTFFPNIIANHISFKIGGLSALNINTLAPASIIIIIVLVLAYFKTQQLEILSLGDDIAHSLGLSVRTMRLTFLVFSAALAGASVSFSGIIGFIGLIVPHGARLVIKSGTRKLYLTSVVWGSTLLLFCDTLARTVFKPFELPVGILLSLIGAPIFFGILFHTKGRGF